MVGTMLPHNLDYKTGSLEIYMRQNIFFLLLYMGLFRLRALPDYWSKEKMSFHLQLCRYRFKLLLRVVYFADNDNNDNMKIKV